MARLAVGMPSRGRPRPSPATTTPSTAWGRPREAAAAATSPAASSARTRVEDTTSSPSVVQGDGHDLDPAGAAELGQQGRVAGRLVAEAEVLADHHRPGGQAVEQHLGGERLGTDLRQLAGELEHQHDLHAGVAEQLDLAVKGGEQGRLAPGAKDGQRVPVEGDRRRRDPAGGRLGGHPVQQGPVAAVDPVEHADGDHGAVQVGGEGGQPVEAAGRSRGGGGDPSGRVTPAPPWGGRGRRCPG